MRPTAYLLCLDAKAGTVARYRKKPGLWRAELLQRAELPADHMRALGSMEVWRVLEDFRLKGVAE
jgi:hypothetical protein